MRPTTEPKCTWLLLQGKTAAQAAFILLTNGTQLNTREKEELEAMLLEDFIVAVRYKLNCRKGPWPELAELLQVTQTENGFVVPKSCKANDVFDVMLFIQAYVEAKG